MPESRRDPHLSAVFGRQFDTDPLAKTRRAAPQIDRYDIARNVRLTLTAGRNDGLVRDVVAAAGDVVLWLDGRLGTTDVWYATMP